MYTTIREFVENALDVSAPASHVVATVSMIACHSERDVLLC
jgi:hypothetical protein